MSKILTKEQFLHFAEEQKCKDCDIRDLCDSLENYTSHGLCYLIKENLY